MQSNNMKTLSKQNFTSLFSIWEESKRTNEHMANVSQLAKHVIRIISWNVVW